MRGILWTIFGFWLCGLLTAAGADTFPLTDGTSVVGDVISYNDNGIVFRLTEDQYSQRVPWTKFSQQALKLLANNPKVRPLAEPFIETPPPSREKKGEIKVHEVSRLALLPKESLFGALVASSVGLVTLLLIYMANLYAAYEIAACRAQPIALVMGVAVVLPVWGRLFFSRCPSALRPFSRLRMIPQPRRTHLPWAAPPRPPRPELIFLMPPGAGRRRRPLPVRCRFFSAGSSHSTGVFLRPNYPVILRSSGANPKRTWFSL